MGPPSLRVHVPVGSHADMVSGSAWSQGLGGARGREKGGVPEPPPCPITPTLHVPPSFQPSMSPITPTLQVPPSSQASTSPITPTFHDLDRLSLLERCPYWCLTFNCGYPLVLKPEIFTGYISKKILLKESILHRLTSSSSHPKVRIKMCHIT